MSFTPGYTIEQIREIVYEYDRQPHGTKTAWRKEHGYTEGYMRRWRHAVYDGDLARGLIPRQDGNMTRTSEPQRRAAAQHKDGQLKRIAQLESRISELEAMNSSLETANDALGKAIGLLHEISAPEPDTDPEQSNPLTS